MIGKTVTYVSGSGKRWTAVITAIPENAYHAEGSGYGGLPTVSLEFRNERGKLIRRPAVLPRNERSINSYEMGYYIVGDE